MKVVGGFDEALSGWMKRLAVTSTSAADSWDFTSETLSKLYYLRQVNDVSWWRNCLHRIVYIVGQKNQGHFVLRDITLEILNRSITKFDTN